MTTASKPCICTCGCANEAAMDTHPNHLCVWCRDVGLELPGRKHQCPTCEDKARRMVRGEYDWNEERS